MCSCSLVYLNPMRQLTYRISINRGPLKGQSFLITDGVTYLVGPNGAGKSQVLHAIREGWCGIAVEGQRGHLNNYCTYDWTPTVYDKAKGAARKFSDWNPLFEKLGQPKVEMLPLEGDAKILKTSTDKETGDEIEELRRIRSPTRNGTRFTGTEISDGTSRYQSYFSWNGAPTNVGPKGRDWGTGGYRNAPANIILWDEPENGLHPDTQRKLVDELVDWMPKALNIVSNGGKQNTRLFVVIATHSPFILSQLSPEVGHHVVCLDNCEIVEQTLADADQLTPSLSRLRVIANRLLGVGLEDVFPERVIYAEPSIELLLTELANKLKLHIPDFFINPQGDSDGSERYRFLVGHFNALNRLRQRWPESDLLDPKIDYIVDDEAEAQSLEKKASSISGDVRVFSVGKLQLEDVYPLDWVNDFFVSLKADVTPWNGEGRISKYMFEELGIKRKDQGCHKCELAKFVAEKIDSSEKLDAHLPAVSEFWDAWQSQE